MKNKKQLQKMQNTPEPYRIFREDFVIEEAKLLVNQEPCRVAVSFSVPYRDWCELQKSTGWEQVIEFLAQKKNLCNQHHRIEEKE